MACLVKSLFGIGLAGVLCGDIALSQSHKAVGDVKGDGLALAERAKLLQVKADFASLDNVMRMYKLNAGNYPTTQQGFAVLTAMPTSSPVPKRWVRMMSKMPKDPWGNDYSYRFPGHTNPQEYEMICVGPDGKVGTGDDISSQNIAASEPASPANKAPAVAAGAEVDKRGADRAACILNQCNAQQAVRTYQNTHQLAVDVPIDWAKIYSPEGYIAKKPTCPAGGTYTYSATIPAFGTLVLKCSHAADLQHVPKDVTGW